MQETIVLFQSHGLTLTAYGLGVGVAVLLGSVLCLLNVKRSFWLCLALIFGGLLGSRLVFCLANLPHLEDYGGVCFLWQLERGGYSLCGSAVGALAVLAVASKVRGEGLGELCRGVLPSLFAVLTVARMSEYFTPEGVGRYLDTETFCFPFTVYSKYMDGVVIPVFLWEVLAALVGEIYCQQKCHEEKTLWWGIGWLCATQLVLESLRGDSFIRFGFVRFHQVAAAMGLCCLMILYLCQKKPGKREVWLRCILFAIALMGVAAIEISLDRTNVSHVLLYGLLGVCSVMMLLCACLWRKAPAAEKLQ